MKIRYRKSFSISLISIPLLILIYSFISGPLHFLWFGFYFLSMGILLLKNPYFELKGDKIVIYRLIGTILLSYNLDSIHDLYIKGNKVYLKIDYKYIKGGKEFELPISKWLVEPSDWHKFEKRIKQGENK